MRGLGCRVGVWGWGPEIRVTCEQLLGAPQPSGQLQRQRPGAPACGRHQVEAAAGAAGSIPSCSRGLAAWQACLLRRHPAQPLAIPSRPPTCDHCDAAAAGRQQHAARSAGAQRVHRRQQGGGQLALCVAAAAECRGGRRGIHLVQQQQAGGHGLGCRAALLWEEGETTRCGYIVGHGQQEGRQVIKKPSDGRPPPHSH